jgi:hypothetical protein
MVLLLRNHLFPFPTDTRKPLFTFLFLGFHHKFLAFQIKARFLHRFLERLLSGGILFFLTSTHHLGFDLAHEIFIFHLFQFFPL